MTSPMTRALNLIFSLSMVLNSNSQTSTEVKFAQNILNAFRSQAVAMYKDLNPNKGDIEEFISDVMKHSLPGVNNDEWIQYIRNLYEESDSLSESEFTGLSEQGKSIGIDWSQVLFKSFVFQVDRPGNSSKPVVRGHVNFQYAGTNYVLFGIMATKYLDDYKIVSIRSVFKGKLDKYVNADVYEQGY